MREPVGIGGVVAALSVTSDLTRGHPPGEAMRACLLATELARRAGLDEARQADVYYTALLRFAGCAATSHEIAAALGGDDIAGPRARRPDRPVAARWRRCGSWRASATGADRLRMLSRASGRGRGSSRRGRAPTARWAPT